MCDLCNYVEKTKLYYDGDRFRIFVCDTCGIPIIALKDHSMIIDLKLAEKMIRTVQLFFGRDIQIRFEQRKIKDHLHWHIIEK